MSDNRDRIAIVGLSGRFPGARNMPAFWKLLESGTEGIRFFDPVALAASGVPESLVQSDAYVPANGYLEDVELFDASFFGMSPREAEITDPQHRLFLECAVHALEDAGHVAETFDGRIGVYAGCGLSTYLLFNLFHNPKLPHSVNHIQFLMGNSGDYLPTRVSYKLNLKGPSVSVNTACSSSLVAVHMACQSLLEFECDMALAGGAGIQLPQEQGYLYQQNSIMSPDGHCRAFDAKAAGTVSGNGVGIVVLRRLEEALADGDDIRAVILGSAINNDGADKIGYTAPSVEGQASVITEALSVSGVNPETIQYVETHGTGTPVGDPIEVEALTRAFGRMSQKRCALGSVKTNIGHLDEAAGVAGLIKTVLALEHGQIPPSLHFQSPNPEIDFESGPFFVNDRLRPWPGSPTPRRAGVSSFGIGGTNAHVVLEQAPTLLAPVDSHSVHIVPVSARTSEALERSKAQLAEHLTANPDLPLAAVAHTQQNGRVAFAHRAFAVGRTLEEIAQGLRSAQTHSSDGSRDRTLAFMFPGQGAQHPGMAGELYESESFFRDEVDRCLDLFQQQGATVPFLTSELDDAALARTSIAQPALFSVEYAVARLWMRWGVEPAFLIGHSLGEYVAACLAGVFSLEDAVQVVSERGRMMQSMPPGAMLAVALPEAELSSVLSDRVDVAAINGPDLCVVSGAVSDIDALEARLSDQGASGRRLATSHGFHSRSFNPILDEFEALVGSVSLSAPRIPVISNTTGRPLTVQQATTPRYWADHMRNTVLFGKGIECLLEQGCGIFLEVGPSDTLSKVTGRISRDSTVIASLPNPREEMTDQEALGRAIGRLWVEDVDVDWRTYSKAETPQRVALPGYPFERERHWVDAPNQQTLPSAGVATVAPNLDNWFYEPAWYRDERPAVANAPLPECCLIFHDDDDLWVRLRDSLDRAGVTICGVRPGDRFEQFDDGNFTIRPDASADYEALANAYGSEPPDCVLHLWSLSESKDDLGFFSVLYLTQSLAPNYITQNGRWLLFSQASHEVTGNEDLSPSCATLSGIAGVIPLEFPSIASRHVDLDPGHPDLASQVLHEIQTISATRLCAWRNGKRWLRSWKSLCLPQPSETSEIEPGATYLITGGIGSMGLALAEYFAEQAACRLVLTGRSDFPERSRWKAIAESSGGHSERIRRTLGRIEAIENSGSTVDYIRADVSDPEATAHLCSHLETVHGGLGGIVHTAGELDPGLLSHKSREAVEVVFDSKIHAMTQLETLLHTFHPSFLILCSSMSSISPIVGQGDYASANAFLDAYAHAANRSFSTRVVSITWGFWQELGIIEKVRGDLPQKKEIEAQINREGLQDAGVKSFARILENPTPAQVVVAPDGLERRSNHPWFDRVVSLTDDIKFLEGSLPPTTWVLQEHVILGQHILPGTAYLEMARAAAAEILGSPPVELREVYFLQPLVADLAQTINVRVVLQRQDGCWGFKILGRDGEREKDAWIEHARGEIGETQRSAPGPIDVSKIREACDQDRDPIPSATEQNAFETSLSEFGPHWHNLVRLHFGSNQALGEFILDAEFANELDHLLLHPSLLDNATGFLSITEEEGALPFSYRSIRIHDALPTHVYSHIRRRGSANERNVSYDVTLTDSSGRVVVEIEAYVLRRVSHESTTSRVFEEKAKNASLALEQPGSLSTLYLAPAPRLEPAADEVEIEVKATGLNFLEVLYSLGMLPNNGSARFPYGLECAGVVRAVGSGVTGYVPGDEVIAYANGCFKAFAMAQTGSVVPKPTSLSMEQAATLPAAYLTAWYALKHVGRLAQGERVLVHSAAGGVGLAAVHVAKMLGAEVFATSGTEEKRDYLLNLGVTCVADSRNPGFGEMILDATAGNGVDVVVNSLGEAFTAESLSVLSRYGRFIELGKRAILANGLLSLRPFERQLTFSAVDVGPDMPNFSEHLKEVVAYVCSGELPPLPLRAFPASDPVSGFEYMARGQHIGKIVFTMDAPSDLLDRATYRPSIGRSFDAIVGLGLDIDTASTKPRSAAVEHPEPSSDLITETERGIARIWRDLLGVARVQRDDNFFDLNGDSLLAAQVISLVHRDLGVKLPFSAIFDAPTVESLARGIDRVLGHPAPPTRPVEIEEGVI